MMNFIPLDLISSQRGNDVVDIGTAGDIYSQRILTVKEHTPATRLSRSVLPGFNRVSPALEYGHALAEQNQAHLPHAGWQTQRRIDQRRYIRLDIPHLGMQQRIHPHMRLDQRLNRYLASAAQQGIVRAN